MKMYVRTSKSSKLFYFSIRTDFFSSLKNDKKFSILFRIAYCVGTLYKTIIYISHHPTNNLSVSCVRKCF